MKQIPLGETLTAAYCLPSECSKREDRFEKLVIVFEECQIHISPLAESDELSVSVLMKTGYECVGGERECSLLRVVLEQKLIASWLATNSMEYTDLLVLAFDTFRPTFLIHSIGGELELCFVDSSLSQ